MHLLAENNKLNQKQIAARTGKSIASVQRTMKKLSEQGRIIREGGKRFGHLESEIESYRHGFTSVGMKSVQCANVNHFFTLLGKMFFTPYGKEFFTYPGKQIFTS